MRKLILAALVAAVFSIPAFAAQTAPAKPQAASPTAAPAPAAAPAAASAKAAAPAKADEIVAQTQHRARRHRARHHKTKMAGSSAPVASE